MTKKYCVIGQPIAHSLSPAIHNALYERYGLDCKYDAYPVDHNGLSGFLSQIQERGICGFNITMPLKQDILPHLAYVSPEARTGVNTVVVGENGLSGYSTDAQGFYSSLQQLGAGYSGQNIVFIGAGAVTGLLCADAVQKNAKSICVVNRTLEKAQAMARPYGAVSDSLSNISEYMPQCGLLVNTTPLGMSGAGHDFETLDFIDLLPSCAVVCDLIYSPPQTTLLKHAGARGLKTMNGLGMLIWQAFYAFEKFCGIMPGQKDYAAVLSQLELRDQ